MQIAHDCYVVVADGRKALYLRNEGDAVHLNLEVVRADEQELPADRDIKSDAPGVSFSSAGYGRDTMQETDFHQQEEDRFAADAADRLRRWALDGRFESLVVVAPPKTLAVLRSNYHVEVERRLQGELAKDLTGHPVDRIEKILMGA
ncbi:host attachment family protein [Sphingomonas sanxanigenens]|uniref:Host attachment protein n=1 Tax=Sphingomonas sanxanigenens DSM 19645 = NX02 TaxID=1123269 RepID=W0ABV8_9SPHN|nr:host attachment family protein [Sphingomonas sanxanigenens]AHE53803.1 hypothetical protein NX02_10430 [Sphingomonas sanxanigenens DSM 19645 = NX02]